jgi:Domain of unknown function (DUF3859)
MRMGVAFVLLSLAPVGAQAQTPRIDRIDVVEYGIYRTETTKRTETPGTAGGFVRTLTNIRNSEVTRTVPARPGVRFGFRYNVVGAPDGTQVPVTIVDKFPKQGLHKPGSADAFYREEYVAQKTIGKESYTDYGFDHDWELVPGTWTIELWYQGRKLAEQSFTVIKP